jgi:hypothetical protein
MKMFVVAFASLRLSNDRLDNRGGRRRQEERTTRRPSGMIITSLINRVSHVHRLAIENRNTSKQVIQEAHKLKVEPDRKLSDMICFASRASRGPSVFSCRKIAPRNISSYTLLEVYPTFSLLRAVQT